MQRVMSSSRSASKNAKLATISHVLFDMDGLLLDTENQYTKAYQEINDEFGGGKEYTFDFKLTLMGQRPLECAKKMIKQYDLPLTPEEWIDKIYYKLNNDYFPNTTWMPGANKFMHHLYKHKVPMAIATSSGDRAFEVKTTPHSRKMSMFNHVVKGSDVQNGKPAPDIFTECKNRFENGQDINPGNCLAFEDSPNGVKAAKAANMFTVMIPDVRMPEHLSQDADLRLASMHDLKPELFGLPPYDYKPVTHVIFDMDGLLLDTTKAYSQVSAIFLKRFNKEPSHQLKMELMGKRYDDIVPRVIEFYDLPISVEDYKREFRELILPRVRECTQLLPGVERFIRHLHKHNVPMAVATSSAKEGFEAKTIKFQDLFDLFSHVVNGSDPELMHGKPSPDIFKLAADRFASKPEGYGSCLVFEDAPNGVQAAQSAGMQSVMIPERNLVDPELTLPATQLLSSMEEIRPEDFGLPKFD